MFKRVYRGEIYKADLTPTIGCEQGGQRPVLIVQNNIGNRYSNTTIILPITTKIESKAKLPTHYLVTSKMVELPHNSLILAEQIRTIDKIRLNKFVGCLPPLEMAKIDKILLISIGLEKNNAK